MPERAVAPTTTTVARPAKPRPPYSFDDSVPPPKVVNTGTNYVAVLKWFRDYNNWLYAHRPDPKLLDALVAPNTKLASVDTQDLADFRNNHIRAFETLGAQTTYAILSSNADAFSARVVEDIRAQESVDATGRVTDKVLYSNPTTYVYIAVMVGRQWRLASLEVESPVQVHL